MRQSLLLLVALVVAWPPSFAGEIESFYGVWEQLGEHCASSKAGMEGYYFEFGPNMYTPGGGTCENVSMDLAGDTLTVTGTCLGDESEPAPMRSVFQMSGSFLIDEFGTKLERCAPLRASVMTPSKVGLGGAILLDFARLGDHSPPRPTMRKEPYGEGRDA